MEIENANCDENVRRLLGFLYRLSGEIMRIHAAILILQRDPQFNANELFHSFALNFNEGRYCHFQCQGYMECLVANRCASPQAVRYWMVRLYRPSEDYFARAMSCFQRMQSHQTLGRSGDFAPLCRHVEAFSNAADAIRREVSSFNMK